MSFSINKGLSTEQRFLPIGMIVPFIGGYFTDGSNGGFTNIGGNGNNSEGKRNYSGPASVDHIHAINGSINNESAHTHTLDLPNYTGTSGAASTSTVTGSVGTGSAATSTNVRPKYLNVIYIMKVK